MRLVRGFVACGAIVALVIGTGSVAVAAIEPPTQAEPVSEGKPTPPPVHAPIVRSSSTSSTQDEGPGGPTSVSSTRTFHRTLDSINVASPLPLRSTTQAAPLTTIYDSEGRVIDRFHRYGTNSAWTEKSVSHAGLYLWGPADNDTGIVGSYTHYIRCVGPNVVIGTYQSCRGLGEFQAVIGWTVTGTLDSCEMAYERPEGGCPVVTGNFQEIYIFNSPGTAPPNTSPTAGFDVTQSTTNPYEFDFTNTSSDQESGPSALSYAWDFGDGSTSTARHPSHRYERGGSYTVTLTVTDEGGLVSTTTREVTVFNDLIVNSTGDESATDPGALGCHTGGTIGPDDSPECTLRAAIETANALGGGQITFAIGGTPTIAVSPPLPVITGETTIDGTTQAGGWVEVIGGGAATLTLGAGTATLRGLALHGAEAAVDVTAGTGHVLEGNRLGVSRSEAAGDTRIGIQARGGSIAAVRDNVISGSEAGVANYSEESIGVIRANRIGVTSSGAALGSVQRGIELLASGPSEIADNVVQATMLGVIVVGAQPEGTSVSANRVTMAGSGDAGAGIVIEGTAGVRVDRNTVVAGNWGGILVAGSAQVTIEDDRITYLSPTGEVLDLPATSSDVEIAHNTVTAASGSRGIGSWADAAALTITNNTVVSAGLGAGIWLEGGAGHVVEDNTVGSPGAAVSGAGVRLSGAAQPAVTGNTVVSSLHGIRIEGDGPGATVAENTVTSGTDGPWHGIVVEDERTGVSLTGNIVAGSGGTGIETDGPSARITGNTVSGATHGILVDGEGSLIVDNNVGVTAGSTAVIGNRGAGIVVGADDTTVRANSIAGSGASGIQLAGAVDATLRANRIWQNAGTPIAGGYAAPQLDAAIISDTDGTRRTTLLVTGIPSDQAGTIEVFANDSCAEGDAEAKYLLSVTRDTKVGRDSRIIQFESARDHFTLTYTPSEGGTSRLSGCQSRATQPDADGDGSPDVLEKLASTPNNPAVAILATTKEQLLIVATDAGSLEQVRVADQPSGAPGNLPYGMVSFRVAGLDAGGKARVTLTTFHQDEPLQGTSYWKYGPQSPSPDPSWYRFDFDPVTGVGATIDTIDVPGAGFRTAHVLTLIDGARGDDDGAANGTITDPGGPVIGATPTETDPPPPGTDPPPAAPGTTTTLGKIKAGKKPLKVKERTVRLTIVCPKTASGPCRGRARIRIGKRVVTKTVSYKVAAGKKKVVKLKVNKKGLRKIRKRKPTKAVAELLKPGAKKPSVKKRIRLRR
jgi:CSLREA domain-containing protein